MRDIDKEKIIDLYKDGMSISQIMDFFNKKYIYADIKKIISANIK